MRLLPNWVAEDGAETSGSDAGRVGEVDFVVQAVESQALFHYEGTHLLQRGRFGVIGTDVLNSHGASFVEPFQFQRACKPNFSGVP